MFLRSEKFNKGDIDGEPTKGAINSRCHTKHVSEVLDMLEALAAIATIYKFGGRILFCKSALEGYN